MGAYRALSDSVRELNRILIGQQEFNGQMELERARIAADNRDREERLIDRKLQREITQDKVNKIRAYNTPQDFSFHRLMKPDQLSNPVMLEGLNRAVDPFGDRGWSISAADGRIVDQAGLPQQVSPKDLEVMMPSIMGVAEAAVDKPYQMQLQIRDLMPIVSRLETRTAKLRKDKRKISEYNASRIALNQAKKALGEAQNFFTPSNLMSFYGQENKRNNKLALWASSKGMAGQAEWFSNKAKEAASLKSDAMNKLLSAQGSSKTYKPELKFWYDKATGEPTEPVWVTVGTPLSAYGFDPDIHTMKDPKAGAKGKDKGMTIDQMGDNIHRDWKEAGAMGDVTNKLTRPSRDAHSSIATWMTSRGDDKQLSPQLAEKASRQAIFRLEEAYWLDLEFNRKLAQGGTNALNEELLKFRESAETEEEVKAIDDAIASRKSKIKIDLLDQFVLEQFEARLKRASGGLAYPYKPNKQARQIMKSMNK
jgi:hypothetical protein